MHTQIRELKWGIGIYVLNFLGWGWDNFVPHTTTAVPVFTHSSYNISSLMLLKLYLFYESICGSICVGGIRMVTVRIVLIATHRWTLAKHGYISNFNISCLMVLTLCVLILTKISPLVWELPNVVYWQRPFLQSGYRVSH